jgi:NADH:ubiquinone oxidoreductase subunit E
LPPAKVRALAEIFEIQAIEIQEVISFYNMFYDRPQGRHHVHVCTNLPCSLRGARGLLRALERHLGIRAGETTPDGRVTLGHEECLGACAYAPLLRVDDRYCEALDADAAKEIVDRLE